MVSLDLPLSMLPPGSYKSMSTAKFQSSAHPKGRKAKERTTGSSLGQTDPLPDHREHRLPPKLMNLGLSVPER